jgi:competence protein ComEC
MPLLVLSFLAGIVLLQQFTELPQTYWLIASGVLSLLCTWKRYWLAVVFILGFLWATSYASYRLAERLPKNLEGRELSVTGYVLDLPEQDPRRIAFNFQPVPDQQHLPSKIRLSWYQPTQTIKAGQHWRFTVKLKRPHGLFNPAGFDYESWLFSQNIGATGYIRSKITPQLLGTASGFDTISVWRQAIADRLALLVPDKESLALIKALSIGDGGDISDAQWRVFRNTGTTHLFVISGSHISLVAGFVFFISRTLWARTGILAIAPHTVAAISALIMAVFYSALAGFSVPTQRAMIMVVVVMLGIILQHYSKVTDSLAWALLLVLLLDPFAVLSPGFWLSFIAVVIILFCNSKRLVSTVDWIKIKSETEGLPVLSRKIVEWRYQWKAKKPLYLFAFIYIHPIMALELSPLTVLFFQQLPIINPSRANFIAIPVVEILIIPLILLALPLMFIYPLLATKLLTVVAQILSGLYWILAEWANSSANIFINLPAPNYWVLLLAILGAFLLFTPKGTPARWLGIVLCLPLFFPVTEKVKESEFILTLLDVGQGLSTVVQTSKHILVFDTGAKSSADFDMGKAALLPFLHSIHASRIDRLIISHGDNDHIGGTQSLIDEIKINSIYTSVPEMLPNNTPIRCSSGQQWQWDNVQFTLLSPMKKNQFASKNNNSCVLKIASNQGSVLLTGDIEAEAENGLLDNAADYLKSDILIAPHHGSKTSSTSAFLKQIHPQWVLIPAGYKNRFHFPHAEVLKRYQQQGIKWFMTGTAGAIKAKLSNAKLELFCYRCEQAKYWHDKPDQDLQN